MAVILWHHRAGGSGNSNGVWKVEEKVLRERAQSVLMHVAVLAAVSTSL